MRQKLFHLVQKLAKVCLRSEPVLPMIRTVHAASFTGSSKLLAKSKAVCSMHSWPYAEQAKVVIFFSTKKICAIRVVKHCIFNFTSPKIEFLPPKNFSQKQKKTNLRSSFHFLITQPPTSVIPHP